MSSLVIEKLGEGITSGVIASILVKVGDEIAVGDTVLEMETDKAVIDITAPQAGTVKKLLVKEGGTIKVGDSYLELQPTATKDSQAVAEKNGAKSITSRTG